MRCRSRAQWGSMPEMAATIEVPLAGWGANEAMIEKLIVAAGANDEFLREVVCDIGPDLVCALRAQY